jgi:hypothetical protein
LNWLVSNSLGNFELLRTLEDCPQRPDTKLDARIPRNTADSLKTTAAQIKVSPSVYSQTLVPLLCHQAP